MVLNPDYKVWMKQHEAGEGGACAADSVDHAGGGSDDGVLMSDAERQLRELERMKNLLTEAEYQQKRSEIIASIGSDGGAGVAMAVAHDPTPVAVLLLLPFRLQLLRRIPQRLPSRQSAVHCSFEIKQKMFVRTWL